MTPSLRPRGTGERIYAILLFAYPRRFRQAYRDGMLEYFRARRLNARSRVRFWLFVLRDLLISAFAEHRENAGRSRARAPSGIRPFVETARRRPQRNAGQMEGVVQDLRHAALRLAREPLFSMAAVAIVAIGIGANTAMFTVVDGILLRPKPWADPDRLVYVYQDSDDGTPGSNSFPAYLDMRAHDDVFTDAAAILSGWSAGWLRDGGVQQVAMSAVTSSYFPTLGIDPLMGRSFDPTEDLGSGPAVAIVSHRTWEREFGLDPGVLGQVVRINGAPVTLVGVGPEGYGGIVPGQNIDFWVSVSTLASVQGRFIAGTVDRHSDHWFDVIARLRPGISVAQTQAAMDVLAHRLALVYPEDNADRAITVYAATSVRIHPDDDRAIYPAGAVLMGIVGMVLLVACANLANLVIARSIARGGELAIRAALGASRLRLVQHLLLESLLLSAAGGALGLIMAERLIHLVSTRPPSLPIPVNPALTVDTRVVLFTATLSLITALAFGLAPAIGASRPNLIAGLKHRDVAHGVRRGFGLKGLLVVAQVAVSVVLLVGAGLLIRSLQHAYAVDLGVDTEHLAVIQPDVGQAGYDRERSMRFYEEVAERIRALPGIDAAGVTSRLPLQRAGSSTLVFDDPNAGGGANGTDVDFAWIGPTYLETLGLPLIHGRPFRDEDVERLNAVAVISETMARRYYGTTDVVGRWFRYKSNPEMTVEIIGVARDTKVRSTGEPPTPFFYRLLPPGVGTRLYVLARTSGDPATAAVMMRQEVRTMDAVIPVHAARTMDDHVDLSLAVPRTAASLLGGVAGFALALASFGLYAVVSFTVSRRTAEVGIRKALGARRSQVATMLIREVFVLVAVGVAVGIGLSVLAAPVLKSLLLGVPAIDPPTIIVVTLTLMAAATGAAAIPAHLAARTDPIAALRRE